jgi:hypoxanthine-DNA glycosylase
VITHPIGYEMENEILAHPFKPIIFKDTEILILGSFPSIQSFEDNFYYAHKRNQFWRLLSQTFGEEELKSIDEKKEFLKRYDIALWDIVSSCKRKNSLDSNLKDIKLNDIRALLKKYPSIQKICFTSKTAFRLYEKNFSDITMPIFYLPSPSPAYASVRFEEKLKEYREVLL